MHEGLPSKATRKFVSDPLEHFSYVIAIQQYSRMLTPNRLVETHVYIITNPIHKLKLPSLKLRSNTGNYLSFVSSMCSHSRIQVEIARIRAIIQAVT